MNPKEAVFEECVKMNCFYCGKYGRNWRCPPNLPNLNYPKMFSEYDEGLFVYYLFDVSNNSNFAGK
jgi:predicted metal-binding protein